MMFYRVSTVIALSLSLNSCLITSVLARNEQHNKFLVGQNTPLNSPQRSNPNYEDRGDSIQVSPPNAPQRSSPYYQDQEEFIQNSPSNAPQRSNPYYQDQGQTIQDYPSNPSQRSNPYYQESQVEESITPIIPASSAIAITFCSNVEFDSEQAVAFPVTAFLAQPVIDSDGNVIAPVNSMVSAKLTPTESGMQLHAEALVIGGLYVPIQTSPVSVPVLASTQRQRSSYSYSYTSREEQWGVTYNVARGIREWIDVLDPDDDLGIAGGIADRNTLMWVDAGLAVVQGIFMGLNNSPPDEAEITEVAEGAMVIFPLLTSVRVPPVAKVATQRNAYFVSSQSATEPCSTPGFNQNQYYYQTNNRSNGGGYGQGNGYQPAVTQDEYD